MTRIVFMGTPGFAVPILSALANSYTIAAVYTRADKPAGRGKQVSRSPVKTLAIERSLVVEQPPSLRTEQAQRRVLEYQPDLIVVAAYGLILPQAILDIPPHGCINTHASLLPRWRGASPITSAILGGEDITGVTLMRMDAGVDTGPLIASRGIRIDPNDTTGILSDKLSNLAANLLLETLPSWLDGKIDPIPQAGESSFTGMVRKEDGLIDWNRPAVEIHRAVRAYNPWPSAYTFWQPPPPRGAAGGEAMLIKIWRAEVSEATGLQPPGHVMNIRDGIAVSTGSGLLILKEVQIAGKRTMAVEEFVKGHQGFVGASLGADRTSGTRASHFY
jgi:methionyl-tRNA formyltransferase